jgi:hypothetical protein
MSDLNPFLEEIFRDYRSIALLLGGVSNFLLCFCVLALAYFRGLRVNKLSRAISIGERNIRPATVSYGLEAAAVISMLLVPVLTFVAVEYARTSMLALFADETISFKLSFTFPFNIIQHNALGLGVRLLALQLPLSALGLGLALRNRRNASRMNRVIERWNALKAKAVETWPVEATHPVNNPDQNRIPCLFIASIVVIASSLSLGITTWTDRLVFLINVSIAFDPYFRGKYLLPRLSEAEKLIDHLFFQAAGALAAATLIAVLLVVVRYVMQKRRRAKKPITSAHHAAECPSSSMY